MSSAALSIDISHVSFLKSSSTCSLQSSVTISSTILITLSKLSLPCKTLIGIISFVRKINDPTMLGATLLGVSYVPDHARSNTFGNSFTEINLKSTSGQTCKLNRLLHNKTKSLDFKEQWNNPQANVLWTQTSLLIFDKEDRANEQLTTEPH